MPKLKTIRRKFISKDSSTHDLGFVTLIYRGVPSLKYTIPKAEVAAIRKGHAEILLASQSLNEFRRVGDHSSETV